MMRHYQSIAQLLGSMQSVTTAPAVKEYFTEVIIASNLLMKKILRNFGHDEVDRLIPDPLKKGVLDAAQPKGTPPSALGGGPEMDVGAGGTPLQ